MDDTHKTKENIISTYHELLGKEIDSKLLRYWEKQLCSRQQSFDDFLQEIYNSLDYKTIISTRFKKIYYELIDVNLSVQTLRELHTFFHGRFVSDKDIFDYITTLPSYIDKYSAIIKNVYLKTRNDPLNTDPVYLTIKHTLNYDIDEYNNLDNNLNTFKTSDIKDIKDIENNLELNKVKSENESYISHMVSFYLNRFKTIENYSMDCLFDDMIGNAHEKNKDKDDNNKNEEGDKGQGDKGQGENIKNEEEKYGTSEKNDEASHEENEMELPTDVMMDSYIQEKYRERYDMELPKKDVLYIRECIRDPVKIYNKIQEIKNLENIVKQLQDDLNEFTRGKSLASDYEKRREKEKKHRKEKERNKEKEKEICFAGVNDETISAFECVFKRPMFVHEYFKYVLQKAYEPDPTPITNFQDIYTKFVEDFNTIRRILNDYLNLPLDEYSFVKTYLYEVDDACFFSQMIDKIVNSEEYKQFMCAKLDELYRSLFKESLQEYDINYVFKKVHHERLDLYNEALNDRLIELKTETDDIISHIFTQYTNVLERAPDVYEIDKLFFKYRALLPTMSYDEINKNTEQMLIMSLEFHDILKKKIKQVVPHIKPRILFDHLKVLIDDLEGETMETLELKINKIKIAESTEEFVI